MLESLIKKSHFLNSNLLNGIIHEMVCVCSAKFDCSLLPRKIKAQLEISSDKVPRNSIHSLKSK